MAATSITVWFQPRWEEDRPDVVAFFVPLSWRDTMPDDSDSLLNKVGFSNGTSEGHLNYFKQSSIFVDKVIIGS